MADINFDCPHCGQNLETDEILSGSGIDCPVCKKYLTIPGTAITTDLPPEPTNINTGKNVADSLKATQLAARAAQAAQAAQAARGSRAAGDTQAVGDTRANLDQLTKRAAQSVSKKNNFPTPTKNTQLDTETLSKF